MQDQAATLQSMRQMSGSASAQVHWKYGSKRCQFSYLSLGSCCLLASVDGFQGIPKRTSRFIITRTLPTLSCTGNPTARRARPWERSVYICDYIISETECKAGGNVLILEVLGLDAYLTKVLCQFRVVKD